MRYKIVKSKDEKSTVWRVIDTLDGTILATFGTKWEAQDFVDSL
jgi:hypothetical protein